MYQDLKSYRKSYGRKAGHTLKSIARLVVSVTVFNVVPTPFTGGNDNRNPHKPNGFPDSRVF